MRPFRFNFLKRSVMTMRKEAATATEAWRWKIGGLSWKYLKAHYSIIPICGITIGGAVLGGSYALRVATKHPEVTWTNMKPEPWNDYKNKQYKFISVGRDYSKSSHAPDLGNEN